MKISWLILLFNLSFLSGCKITDVFDQTEAAESSAVSSNDPHCVFDLSQSEPCQLNYWLNYWFENGGKPWQKRKQMIASLDNSDSNVLRKVLLSQSVETPYQDRLRAQNWLNGLLPKMTERMRKMVNVLIAKPNQERLEFESALAILTRINAQQAKQLEDMSQDIEAQKKQIEKLLNIEASLMRKSKKDNP